MEIDSNALVLSGVREAGCFREVAALHSDPLRQVPLYYQEWMNTLKCHKMLKHKMKLILYALSN